MPTGDIPLFSMLKARMKWHNQRQNVLAENVANADVPNYKSRDLKELKFDVPVSLGPQRTNVNHIGFSGNGTQPDLFTRQSSIFETTPAGNSVSLEDEMLKLGQNQQDYQAAATLYQKSLKMLSIATGRRS